MVRNQIDGAATRVAQDKSVALVEPPVLETLQCVQRSGFRLGNEIFGIHKIQIRMSQAGGLQRGALGHVGPDGGHGNDKLLGQGGDLGNLGLADLGQGVLVSGPDVVGHDLDGAAEQAVHLHPRRLLVEVHHVVLLGNTCGLGPKRTLARVETKLEPPDHPLGVVADLVAPVKGDLLDVVILDGAVADDGWDLDNVVAPPGGATGPLFYDLDIGRVGCEAVCNSS